MTLLSMRSRCSVDRASAWCSGSHGLIPFEASDHFVPRSCHGDQLTFHNSLPRLKFTIFIRLPSFSSCQNWTFCNSWCNSKFTWASKDTFWQDHAQSFAAGCKEWQEHWRCDNHGWLFCCRQLVWKQTSCGFYSWVT